MFTYANYVSGLGGRQQGNSRTPGARAGCACQERARGARVRGGGGLASELAGAVELARRSPADKGRHPVARLAHAGADPQDFLASALAAKSLDAHSEGNASVRVVYRSVQPGELVRGVRIDLENGDERSVRVRIVE